MAKYDNSGHWEAYRDRSMLAFLREFSSELNLDDAEISEFYETCLAATYEETQALIGERAKNYVPLEKLRTRFRTYAYKMRKDLSSISISNKAKDKLDEVVAKHGFSDYSDAIIFQCQHTDFNK